MWLLVWQTSGLFKAAQFFKVSGSQSSSSELAHLESIVSLTLPGVWQVKRPKLWKSLKFLGNMWTFVYFSAEAGRVESCQDAALSLSRQEGQWAECERGRGPDHGQGRWKTHEARGEGRVKQRTDRRRDRGWAEVVESRKWRMEGWKESNRKEGERQTPSTGYQIKGMDKRTLRFHWAIQEVD